MEFLWTNEITPPVFPALNGDLETEVLVIGGGMAGILCALKLKEKGVDYILVEGRQIGSGITKGTTAVLTAQHDTLYQDMIQKSGQENAQLYLEANLQAVQQFRMLSHCISCDFEEKPSVMYSLHDRALMEREAKAVRSLGFDGEFTTQTPLPFPVAGAVRYPGMAQFHPLKFLYGAARGLNILENTFVQKLEGTTAVTPQGRIRAKKVIIATHYPFLNSHGLYFMKLYQKRSYVIALENALDLGCTIEDIGENGVYLRNYNGLLLIGGGDHRTGGKGACFSALRAFARRYFPQAKEVYAWANQDCVSLDGVPYIGPYSAGLPNVYVASGFNLWGMTTSMAASQILVDLILCRENRFAPAFAPDRSMLSGQLFSNLGTTLLDFVSPTAKRCSHLGCALKWNAAEHSWDCPCHGSRFDAHGRLIDNPAMRDSHVE
ncbi:MAG: FAD-dependent oxidoreductase [Oscillibacter sp.]|jgi:glycine/D-amino acid oxidase-like deaminating enzyme|nr:FAD-dependent oxidoreductase [Oscillibacter sp.]